MNRLTSCESLPHTPTTRSPRFSSANQHRNGSIQSDRIAPELITSIASKVNLNPLKFFPVTRLKFVEANGVNPTCVSVGWFNITTFTSGVARTCFNNSGQSVFLKSGGVALSDTGKILK